MDEPIFNLYLLIDDSDVITALGGVAHGVTGGDEEKLQFLQERVEADLETAKRYPIPDNFHVVVGPSGEQYPGISPQRWAVLCETGEYMKVFEQIFEENGASGQPLFCITPVKIQPNHREDEPEEEPPAGPDETKLEQLRFVESNYDKLVDFARQCFEEEGRGALIVDLEGEVLYLAARQLAESQFSFDLREMVQSYESRKELVVVFLDNNRQESSYRIGFRLS